MNFAISSYPRKVAGVTMMLAMGSAWCWGAKPNVLFLSIDDLKTSLGVYGDEVAQTPNIDRLAGEGAMMLNNHVQLAVCAPSRMSMFSGLRPDETKVWNLRSHLVKENPDAVTMQEHFKSNGYKTAGAGKIMHGSDPTHNHPPSWTIPYTNDSELPFAPGYGYPAYGMYQNEHSQKVVKQMKEKGITHWKEQRDFMAENEAINVTESMDVPDAAYVDGALTVWANDLLKQFAESGNPFFLTIGFKKPHLPFVAPKKYWDLYDRDRFSLAAFRDKALNSPDLAYHSFGELRSYSGVSRKYDLNNPLPEDLQRDLIHGYYACVSYIDAQVGMVLDQLESFGLAENTIVVLWGDHGYHLGDHGLWNKHSNFEQATKAPLIIDAPGFPKGVKVSGPTEMVDIFPTLCELAGIEPPYALPGKSLIPAMKDGSHRVKEFAVSQYPRRNGQVMGYALRDDRYRFVMWIKNGWKSYDPYREELVEAVELYDYLKDPNETINQAGNPEVAEAEESLKKQMLSFFKSQEKKIESPSASVPDRAAVPLPGGDTFDLARAVQGIQDKDLRFASVSSAPDGKALLLNFELSPKWPSVDLVPADGGVWDLSGYEAAEVTLTNTGSGTAKAFVFFASTDDSQADKKRAAAKTDLAPGQTETIRFSLRDASSTLSVDQVGSLRLFTGFHKAPVQFRLESVRLIPGG